MQIFLAPQPLRVHVFLVYLLHACVFHHLGPPGGPWRAFLFGRACVAGLRGTGWRAAALAGLFLFFPMTQLTQVTEGVRGAEPRSFPQVFGRPFVTDSFDTR